MENQKPTFTPGDIEAALRVAYRKSRTTGVHEAVEGLPFSVKLQTIHFSAWGKREALELAFPPNIAQVVAGVEAPGALGTTINVGKGYKKTICRLISEGVPGHALLAALLHAQKAPVAVLAEEADEDQGEEDEANE